MRLLLGKWGNTKDRLISNLFQRATADGGVLGSSIGCIDAAYSSADNSSLLTMVPAFGKAGKLFSIIPEDGGGDFAVVRNTTASYVGQGGLIRFAAANEPRFDWTNGCPVLLDEDAATNLLLHSNDFNNAVWIKSLTLGISSGQQSPTVAGNEGWTLTDSDPLSALQAFQIFTFTGNDVCYSIRVRKTTGTPTSYPVFQLAAYTDSTFFNANDFIFNTTTGSFVAASIPPVPQFSNPFARSKSLNSDWWEIEIGGTKTNGTTGYVIVFPAASSNGTTFSEAATGSATYYGNQLEFALSASSYIPTTTAAATRNADVITITPPAGTSEIVTTFEDGTTQVVTSIPGTFTIPNGRVAKVIMT